MRKHRKHPGNVRSGLTSTRNRNTLRPTRELSDHALLRQAERDLRAAQRAGRTITGTT